MLPLISIVTPVYNEELTLHAYYDRLTRVLDGLKDKYAFEIIFTDNCSRDRTFDVIKEFALRDGRVRGCRFSRNFGYQRSIWTGYALSRGDAVLELDADLQDPPELLPSMLQEWSRGAMIVYGVRSKRNEGYLMELARRLYYRLIRFVSDDDLPNDAGDFVLLDRRVVNYIKDTYDPNIYIRGLVFSVGFKRVGIEYERAARAAGESKFDFRKMLQLALDGLVRHSTIPLRLAYYVGILFSFLSLILIATYVIARIFAGADWPAGFATTTVVQLISIGLNSLLLGLLGEYVSRIYGLQRRFPMSVIDEVVGGPGEQVTDDHQEPTL